MLADYRVRMKLYDSISYRCWCVCDLMLFQWTRGYGWMSLSVFQQTYVSQRNVRSFSLQRPDDVLLSQLASTDTIVARNWHQINVSDKNILQLALGLCPTITVEPKKDTKHTQVFKDDQAWWTGRNISRDWLITTKTRSVGRRLLVKFLSRTIWSNSFLDSGWGEMALCCVLIGTFFKPKMG